LDNWAGQWDDLNFELERIVGAGDRVVCLTHHRGRGKSSGVELRVAYVHTIRNGKGVRWEMFDTWEEALEAAGLRE
jgi:ketosteroid isomerase-like protein